MGDKATGSSWLQRGWWLWVLAIVLLAMGFEHFLRPFIARRTMPTATAEWIWADVRSTAGWVGFFALRDFSLDNVPQGSTTLTVTADEEYVAFLNGHAIGSGRYRPGGGVDVYEVSRALVEGDNRLLIELRSAHSVGGLLLRLAHEGETLVVSDDSWQVLSEYREDVKWPGTVAGELAPVRVWGRPPTGRWSTLGKAVGRPRLHNQLLSRRPLPAAVARLDGNGRWHPLPAELNREEPLGNWVTFDFGRVVSGFVNLVPAHRGGARGLFWVSEEAPPDARGTRPTGRLFALVGQGSWTDAVPRTFRYVTVVSLAEIAGGRVFVLKPDLADELVVPDETVGVLGLEPPKLRSPVEDEFWREFESLSSGGGSEDS